MPSLSDREVSYRFVTRRANRKKLAGEAMKLLARNGEQPENNAT
jgi:hypothetical protein